jgi:hypothetical protein
MEDFEVLAELAQLKTNAIEHLEKFYNEHKEDKEAVPMGCAFLLVKDIEQGRIETVAIPGGDFFQNNAGKDVFAQLLRHIVKGLEEKNCEVMYYLFSSEVWVSKSDDLKDPRNQPGPSYVPPSERPDDEREDAVMILIEAKTFSEMMLYNIDRSNEKVKLVPKEETIKRLKPNEVQGRFVGILCK